ncbi:MAG: hypothetical protein M3Y13_07690 [Armatimonadota bacterium]|nr:hypothetical protein [Armatimonadota bacterium]
MTVPDETISYRLAAPKSKSNLWAAFTPSGHDGSRTWQLAIAARNRGGSKTLAPLLETTALRPLASITLKNEVYPLTIGWHELKRGGILRFGGERKTGMDGSSIAWEMAWTPAKGEEGCFLAEMRVRSQPRREGLLRVHLNTALHQPSLWLLPAAAMRGHCALLAWSHYSQYAAGFALLEKGGWDEAQNGFGIWLRGFPLGGGKTVRFSLRFCPARTELDARGRLATQYAALADSTLHALESVTPFCAEESAARLLDPASYAVQGAERLYLNSSQVEENTFFAGFPHFPADALQALWNWGQCHPSPGLERLVRFGGRGIAADFQVLGREGEPEPNKGAFWDKRVNGVGKDFAGGATLGLLSNARLARSLFLLHKSAAEPMFEHSALNICQWLLLKQNAQGFYDGERVHATRGVASDGRFLPQPCSLDGVEAIRVFVLAYQATRSEVWIKSSWKIVESLLGSRLQEFDAVSPVAVSSVVLSLLALDAEAPNERLRAAVREWGAWLRALPLRPGAPGLNADGLHAGLYECARAGFALYAFERDPAYLRYAFYALEQVPVQARAASWHSMALRSMALLSLGCLLPQGRPDFDAQTLSLDWRCFAPDPATDQYVSVRGSGEEKSVEYLPLVCRANDQMLVVVLAPPTVEAVTILKNGKRPLARDLFTGVLDSDVPLHPPAGENWARVGLFTVDP